MRKLFLAPVIALLFFLAVPLCLAEESIFKDDILSGHSVDVDDDYTFVITLNKYATRIFVNGGDIFQTVYKEECESLGEIYRVCFYNVTYDEEEDDIFAEVEIFRRSPDISVTKQISDSEIFVGEEAIITLKVKNSGDPVEKITLIDDYPGEIEIYDVEGTGCMEHENSISWSGHLDEDEEQTCTFTIVATEELDKELAAKVRYWTGLKWETEYSTSIDIEVEPTLSFKTSIVREDFEFDGESKDFDWEEDFPTIYPGEEPRLILELTNNNPDEDIDVESFYIDLPEGTEFLQTSHLRFNYYDSSENRHSEIWSSDRIEKINSRRLSWSGWLGNNSEKRYVLKLRNSRTGLQNILINLDYEVEYDEGETKIHDEEKISFLVQDPGLAFSMAIDDDSELFSIPIKLTRDEDEQEADLQSMHPYRFRIYAQNLNPFSVVEDIDFWVVTDLAKFSRQHRSMIEEEKQVIPWSLVLIPPELYTDKTFKFNVSADFVNAFGERYHNSTEFEFNVKAFEPIGIDQDSEEGDILEGKEKTVFTVTLKNERVEDIRNVFVHDDVPEELEVMGVTSNKLKLVKDEENEVYKYEITPPVVREDRKFNITTYVSYFDENLEKEFNYSESTILTVIPREPEVDVEISFDEPDSIYPGSLIDATLTISNNDDQDELIRDITVFFPVQRDFDLIGPKTFYIDRLDPGESVELDDIIKIRPKLSEDDLELQETVVQFHDSYGGVFYENTSEERFDVEEGLISGPAIFVNYRVPPVVNISESFPVIIEARNLGNEPASVSLTAGEKQWNTSVPASGLRTMQYDAVYDNAGNYSLPSITAKVDYYGRDLYTGSGEKRVEVKLITPEIVLPDIEPEPIPDVEAAPSPQDIESIEQEMVEEEKKDRTERSNTVMIVIGVLVMVLIIVGYIFYHKGKKETAAPFLE